MENKLVDLVSGYEYTIDPTGDDIFDSFGSDKTDCEPYVEEREYDEYDETAFDHADRTTCASPHEESVYLVILGDTFEPFQTLDEAEEFVNSGYCGGTPPIVVEAFEVKHEVIPASFRYAVIEYPEFVVYG